MMTSEVMTSSSRLVWGKRWALPGKGEADIVLFKERKRSRVSNSYLVTIWLFIFFSDNVGLISIGLTSSQTVRSSWQRSGTQLGLEGLSCSGAPKYTRPQKSILPILYSGKIHHCWVFTGYRDREVPDHKETECACALSEMGFYSVGSYLPVSKPLALMATTRTAARSFPSSGRETGAGRTCAIGRRCRTSLWKTGMKGSGEASQDGAACQVCLIPVRCQLPPLLLTINVTDRCLMPMSAYNHVWWKDLRLWCCQWILCQTGNLYLVFTSLEVT